MRAENKEIHTKHIILTFDGSTLLESTNAVFIRYTRHRFRCQWFGHGTNSCCFLLDRAECSEYDHPIENCQAKLPRKINLHQDHREDILPGCSKE